MAKGLKILFLAFIVTVTSFISIGTAIADIYTIDRTDDDNTNGASICNDFTPNDCSLRGAVIRSNIHAGNDIINVPAGTYTLTITSGGNDQLFGDLDVDDSSGGNLAIVGEGASFTFIQAGTSPNNGIDRVLELHQNQLNLNNVTIRYGTVTGNGGGIYTDSTMVIINSSIIDSVANGSGGGIYNGDARNLTITNSTISNNSAGADGGGIFNNGGTVNLTNVTISGNESDLVEPNDSGGGIYNAYLGILNMTNVTLANNIAHNSQGDGIYNNGTANLVNTLIANNGDQNCGGPQPLSADHTLSSDSSCNFVGGTFMFIDTDPIIGPLANNGGPTQTHALMPGSPAIDNGRDSGAPPFDQRGYPRVDIPGVNQDGADIADIGAYEYQQTVIPTMTQWGMIIFMILAGFVAVAYLRRQRKATR